MDERQRLTDLYFRMTDEELLLIAADSASLTEVAQHAVAAEVQRRNLTVPEVAPAVDEQFELVIIRQFRDLPEAIFAKGVLDSAEIESYLVDENIVRMDWFISNLVGGVKLQVKREDVAAALELLETPAPEDLSERDES
jgi:hypothetical protein